MAETDFDQTATYDSSEEEKTGAYESRHDISDTHAYDDSETSEGRYRTHGLKPGDSIDLKDRRYLITGIISHGTGEAVIYKIEDPEGQVFALKLYFEFPNPKHEPNYETLKRIINLDDPDILKLYDFGAKFINEKYENKYCYEISHFAVGGDLLSVKDFRAKYTVRFVEKTIVPELFKGIKKLHENKIFHCDLKPANVFYLDEKQTDIVIGDYGSGKYFGVLADSAKINEDRAVRATSTVKGTPVYLAPEQGQGIVSNRNDYYSFGMILLHLLYPEWLCGEEDLRKPDKTKFERIHEHQFDSKKIIKFDDAFGRINDLIAGLTLAYNKNRWGPDEVEKWLEGEDVAVRYGGTDSGSIQGVKLGYAVIQTEQDLVRVIDNYEDWYADLFDDEANYRLFQDWLSSYRDIPTRREVDQLVKSYLQYGLRYVQDALTRYFEPARPITIEEAEFDIFGSPDVAAEVGSLIGKLDDIWKTTTLENLAFYVHQLEFSLGQRSAASGNETKILINALLDKIYSVFGEAQQPGLKYRTELFKKIDRADCLNSYRLLVDLFYAFNPARVFRDSDGKSYASLAEVGLCYVRDESEFLDEHMAAERKKFLEKTGRKDLLDSDYSTFLFEVFKDEAESKIEILDITFNRKRDYLVSYKFFKSLKKFLSKKGIAQDLTSHSDSHEIYAHRKGFMQSFESESEHFIKTVRNKHTIKNLSEENESRIKEQFATQCRERFLYLLYEGIFQRGRAANSPPLDKLEEQHEAAGKKFHWRPAVLTSAVAGTLFLILYIAYAYSAGWIVWDSSARYITFNAPVKVDGVSYGKGDFVMLTSENEFFNCFYDNGREKCFPTQNLVDQRLNQQTVPIENFGKFDYEFKNSRQVFKVSKPFNLVHKGRKIVYTDGQIVDIRIDNNSTWCFDFGNKGTACYSSDSKFYDDKGKYTGTFTNYGSAISNYRGRNMFTFNRAAAMDGVTYPQGSSWEDAGSSSPWVNCFNSNGRKCFLTKSGVDRLKQPDVPVLTKYGTIASRKTDFSVGTALTLTFFFVALAFAAALPACKWLNLFILKGRIGTAKFKQMSAAT